jgi:hypothetical protein
MDVLAARYVHLFTGMAEIQAPVMKCHFQRIDLNHTFAL